MAVPRSPRSERGPESADCRRPDLARLLVHVDDLPPADEAALRRHANECALCGPRLALIEEAEAWLAGRATRGECPAAEELYDFGRGPGARPLSPERELALRDHVDACRECAGLVTTLATRPPVPLVLEEGPAERPAAPAAVRTPSRPRSVRAPSGPRPMAWVSLAAAALLLVTLGFFWNRIFAGAPATEYASAVVYPAEPVLRGDEAGALYFPRGRVLAGPPAGHPAGLWHAARFELAAREGATRYRVHLARADGGAFDPGTPLCVLSAPEPLLGFADLEPASTPVELAPGRYTWEAWARVDGLDVPLGRRDFDVVHEPDVERALAAQPADARGRSALLALLHERGLVVDARAYARSLPPSAERDAYLRRLPGR
jgi:hypothetical protein